MLGIKKTRAALEYTLITALFYVAGGAFSYTNYSLQITLFFFTSLILCIITGNIHFVLRRRVFLPLLTMSFFIMIVPILNNDRIPTYIAIVMQLCIGAFCSSIISVSNFKTKYINVMVFFALASLIGFALGFIMPSIALHFPITVGDGSVDYYNAYIYVFMKPKGYATFFLTNRNSGICWEPGAYQCFLNIALLFIFDEERHGKQNAFYIKTAILIITILTTVSTTGYIVMGIILIAYRFAWKGNSKRSISVLAMLVFIFLILSTYTSVLSRFQLKIGKEFVENSSFLDRISLNKLKYWFSESGLPYVFGMSFAKWVTYEESLWNSIIHSLLCLGLPFTVIHLRGYWKGSNFILRKKGILFIIMLICASSETFFWRVLFNTIAFYGWIGARENDELR